MLLTIVYFIFFAAEIMAESIAISQLQENDELEGGTTGRITRHQLFAHPDVGETLETTLLAEAEQDIDDDQYRNDQQPVEVLGMFESQYVFHSNYIDTGHGTMGHGTLSSRLTSRVSKSRVKKTCFIFTSINLSAF